MQGVGFRATARSVAYRHPVVGWVRNEPDGAVRLEAEGAPEALDAFLADVRASLGRFIEGEDASPSSPRGDERSFEIAR